MTSFPIEPMGYESYLDRQEAFFAARLGGQPVDEIIATGEVTAELPIARIQEIASTLLEEIGSDAAIISGFAAELEDASSLTEADSQIENLTSMLAYIKAEVTKLAKESVEKEGYIAEKIKTHERLRAMHAAALASLKRLKDTPPSNIYGLEGQLTKEGYREGFSERASRQTATQTKQRR